MAIKFGNGKKHYGIMFGPAGIGPVKNAVENLERYNKLWIKACEIPFTYGIFIHKDSDAVEIGKAAKKFNVRLSIHAPYWLNLNSKEKRKIQESKKRILDCCRIGNIMGVEIVVFHAGYFGGMDKEETYQNIKKAILEIVHEIKKKGWKVKIAPETMGKINVFGSIDEIARLVRDTGCSFCIDFAHIEARDKKVDYDKIKELFGKYKEWHCHFSGIVYGEKGERHHKLTPPDKWKELLKELRRFEKNHEIFIINESPNPFKDTLEGMKIIKKIK